MTKIRIISDIHLEFCGFMVNPMPDDSENILVVAGDISTYKDGLLFPFLEKCAAQFREVLFVLGNHDYYYGNFHKVHLQVRKQVETMANNVHFLENTSIVIDGILFLGATLWSNFNNNDAAVKKNMLRFLSDFNLIGGKDGYITANEMIKRYNTSTKFIKKELDKWGGKGKVVLVTHFLPTPQSIHKKYEGSEFNHYFASDLLGNLDRKIDVAIHGHTHESFDYDIGDTRVICNPFGYYGAETNMNFNNEKIISINSDSED